MELEGATMPSSTPTCPTLLSRKRHNGNMLRFEMQHPVR